MRVIVVKSFQGIDVFPHLFKNYCSHFLIPVERNVPPIIGMYWIVVNVIHEDLLFCTANLFFNNYDNNRRDTNHAVIAVTLIYNV